MGIFNKTYDQIVKGFTKVKSDLRVLEQRETEKSITLDREIVALRDERNVALKESVRAGATADKLDEFFGKDE